MRRREGNEEDEGRKRGKKRKEKGVDLEGKVLEKKCL